MKLKTLEDFRGYYSKDKNKEWYWAENSLLDKLKHEAIKWVKMFEQDRNLIRGFKSRSGQEIVLMSFFNITEADLK